MKHKKKDRPQVRGWYTAWEWYDGRWVPTVGLFEGAADKAPKEFVVLHAPQDFMVLDESEFARAQAFEGRGLVAYAVRFDDVRPAS